MRHPRRCTLLQDESNPDFVAEVVELYFEDSASKLDTLQARLAEPAPSYSQVRAPAVHLDRVADIIGAPCRC